jgi:hypothetical protein
MRDRRSDRAAAKWQAEFGYLGEYLVVRNWERFQVNFKKGMPAVMDSVHKVEDPQYQCLSIHARYLLDESQRQMAKTGKIANDPAYICRTWAIHTRPRSVGSSFAFMVPGGGVEPPRC